MEEMGALALIPLAVNWLYSQMLPSHADLEAIFGAPQSNTGALEAQR